MKASELRIGNWYERNDLTHHQITIDDLVYLSKGEDIQRIHPIQLTEEWLLKFGFEKRGYRYSEYFSRERFPFEFTQVGPTTFTVRDDNGHPVIDIDCVHQLQNLYFTLTREELSIK